MAVPFSPIVNAVDSLALAMVASSDAPLLLLDGDLNLIAASRSFYRVFHIEPADIAGGAVFGLGAGEWDVPQLRSLLAATASGHAAIDAYEMDLDHPRGDVRRLVIKAEKLHYGDADATRLLVTVSDVTDARIAAAHKDELIREKAVLLQEVQHRVANSLQIISSVLLQTARKVQSDETRGYLEDAHNRVMSIATVQKQLASSSQGDVELRPYFTQLCQSLGASMIRDHSLQSIAVTGDAGAVTADVSVSFGLIVTELVINALKHAFPGGRAGKITVDYRCEGEGWRLSVGDDGVGMPKALSRARSGLGTSIVEALARQLDSRVDIADAHPGTMVSIAHAAPAAIVEHHVAAPAKRAP